MPLIQANGIMLHYLIHGAESSETLLMINGAGQWHEAWYRNIPALAEHFRVIVFDNRGIGKSDKPDMPYTLDLLAEDAMGLLDSLAVDKCHVVGHSMGAGVGLMMLRKAPHRVSKLAMASSYYWGPQAVLASPPLYGEQPRDPLELVRRGARFSVGPDFEKHDPTTFQKIIEMRFQSQQPPQVYLRQSQSAFNYFERDHIAIAPPSCPVLLMYGTHDQIVPPANSQNIADLWPKAQIVEIPKAGHLFNIEKPSETNAALIEFLKDKGNSTSSDD